MKRVLLTGALLSVVAGATASEKVEFFEARIRPILAQECYECHSESGKQKGGLLLDSRPGWQAGGDSGEVIVPGNPAASLLVRSIRHEIEDLEMPKSGGTLEPEIIADFEKWILNGAVDPRDTAPSAEQIAEDTDWNSVLERRKQWWAFLPVADADGESTLDTLVLDRIMEKGLKPAEPAAPTTLIRRLSYVLTGLPPSDDQRESFLSGRLDYKDLVEELMGSPAFGEKWARHFMDWVRYAESYGSEGDPAIPYAYRYRDYLIRAFNHDVPWPQMVKEAIAGDLLPEPRIAEGINESAIGIGQLRMVLHGFSPVDSLDEQVTFTDNQIDTVTKAFQALTVSCARCHNHKFDAISQADFYSLYGIFTSTHPAVIDATAPGVGEAIRGELSELKGKIKSAIAAEWLKGLGQEEKSGAVPKEEPLSMEWTGMPRLKAGEFAVALDGGSAIERIYPAAYVSDRLTDRDRGVVFTKRFKNPGGKLWFRIAGGGGVKAKYVVQNYPRTGTIHKAVELKDGKGEMLAWRSLDLDFWKDDEVFLQVTTAADMPAEFKQTRSWFALAEARILESDAPAPANPPVSKASPRYLVQAWLDDRLTSAGAEALNKLLQSGKLANGGLPEVDSLVRKYRELEKLLPEPVRVPGVVEADAKNAHLFVRGDHKQAGEVIPRRFLDALDPEPFETQGSGRLELAEHLADMRSNPLTARVIVNRLWHHVFGRGIVASVDNFGKLGEKPTHPDLLDFLASRFIDEGGSIKAMLRRMVTSETFRRSSNQPANGSEIDPENKLLSHWSIRRLEAEAIRDSIIGLSGNLDRQLFGESVTGNQPRRSVYVRVIRNRLDPLLTVFDAPVPFSTRGKRDATNVPAQSLTLLNDPDVVRWSREWAERVVKESSSPTPVGRIQEMFVDALGRSPDASELRQSVRYMETLREEGLAQEARLDEANRRISMMTTEIQKVLDPVRARLQKELGYRPPAQGLPEPMAEWTFDKDLGDTKGRLSLELVGNARIEDGALWIDGHSMARTGTLPAGLKAKTLEAWVMLDDLKQRGGGVITVQETDGGLFDSLVYAERASAKWFAGSNHGERSELFEGAPETEAASRPVHVAIVYQGDGTITGYRDGKPYGRTYRKAPRADFSANHSQVLLGCRHGAPNGNRGLSGRIFRARLYSRALKASEIAETARIEGGTITEDEMMTALSSADRERVLTLREERDRLSIEVEHLKNSGGGADPELQAWAGFAQSLINLKEFIYLR
jgi:mono/diheme cytochrome c family protein